jgi:hypothetical protein
MNRNIFLKLRVTPDEAELFNQRAQTLGVSVSQLIRDTALNGPVSVTVDKSQAGFEFRRTGALLKHLYPARDQRWTVDDKKQWWALVQNLRDRADKLESMAFGGSHIAVPPSKTSTCALRYTLTAIWRSLNRIGEKMMTANNFRSALQIAPPKLAVTSPVRDRGRPRKTDVVTAAVKA